MNKPDQNQELLVHEEKNASSQSSGKGAQGDLVAGEGSSPALDGRKGATIEEILGYRKAVGAVTMVGNVDITAPDGESEDG